MSSVVRPISVDSDSVIYEHIIPRSVRQKWMRRTSSDRLDLILTSPRDRLKVNKPDKNVGKSIKEDRTNKGNEYGDSIVSHDVQSMKYNDSDVPVIRPESLITPEEEKAVFNAFGVKLRHTGIQSTTKYAPLGNTEGDENAIKHPLEVDAMHLEENIQPKKDLICPETEEKNTNAFMEIKDTKRKPRPLSMPNMTEIIEKNYQMQVDSLSLDKPRPKAYISPHAKVPWKRNIAKKAVEARGSDEKGTKKVFDEKYRQEKNRQATESMSTNNSAILHNKHGGGLGKVEDPMGRQHDISNRIDLDNHRKDLHFVDLVEKHNDAELPAHNEITDLLQSVSDRRRTFEKFDGAGYTGVTRSPKKQVAVSPTADHVVEKANHNKNFHKDKNVMVSEEDSCIKEKQKFEGESKGEINSIKKEGTQKLIKIDNAFPSQQTEVVKHQKAQKVKDLSLEDSHKKLLNIFQSMPTYKPEVKINEKTHVVNKEERKKSGSNESNSQIDKNIAFSIEKRFEKKIKKMVILTGEQRDKELKSKLSSPVKKGTSKRSKTEISHDSAASIRPAESKSSTAIPVTNLDDTTLTVIDDGDHDIPITNLDDLPALSNSSLNLKTNVNQTASGPKNHEFAPTKKPGKYDADRRELIAPKVVFENPVTGLIPALSPKGKSRKVCALMFSCQKTSVYCDINKKDSSSRIQQHILFTFYCKKFQCKLMLEQLIAFKIVGG